MLWFVIILNGNMAASMNATLSRHCYSTAAVHRTYLGKFIAINF